MFLSKIFSRKMAFWRGEVLLLSLGTTPVIQGSYSQYFKRKLQTSMHHTFKKIKSHKHRCDRLAFELLSVQGQCGRVIKNRKNFQEEDDSPISPISTSGGRKLCRPLGYIFFIGLSVSLCLKGSWLKEGVSFLSQKNVSPDDLKSSSKEYFQPDEAPTRPQTAPPEEEGNAIDEETNKAPAPCNSPSQSHQAQTSQATTNSATIKSPSPQPEKVQTRQATTLPKKENKVENVKTNKASVSYNSSSQAHQVQTSEATANSATIKSTAPQPEKVPTRQATTLPIEKSNTINAKTEKAPAPYNSPSQSHQVQTSQTPANSATIKSASPQPEKVPTQQATTLPKEESKVAKVKTNKAPAPCNSPSQSHQVQTSQATANSATIKSASPQPEKVPTRQATALPKEENKVENVKTNKAPTPCNSPSQSHQVQTSEATANSATIKSPSPQPEKVPTRQATALPKEENKVENVKTNKAPAPCNSPSQAHQVQTSEATANSATIKSPSPQPEKVPTRQATALPKEENKVENVKTNKADRASCDAHSQSNGLQRSETTANSTNIKSTSSNPRAGGLIADDLKLVRFIEANYSELFRQELIAFIKQKISNSGNNRADRNSESDLEDEICSPGAQLCWKDLPGLLKQLKKDQVDISRLGASGPILETLFHLPGKYLPLMNILVTTFEQSPFSFKKYERTDNLLNRSIASRKLGYLNLFLEKTNMNVNEGDFMGPPLIYATIERFPEAVELLLFKRSDICVTQRDSDGKTALDYAKNTAQKGIYDMLFKQLYFDAGKLGQWNQTLLHTVVSNKDFSTAMILLRETNIKDSHQDIYGSTALHVAVLSWPQDWILEFLKARDFFNVNIPDGHYRTPLHYAVERNYEEVVPKLVRLSCALNPVAIPWQCLCEKAQELGLLNLLSILNESIEKYKQPVAVPAITLPCPYCKEKARQNTPAAPLQLIPVVPCVTPPAWRGFWRG